VSLLIYSHETHPDRQAEHEKFRKQQITLG